ncbi:hypothetical protein CEK28_08720 [Xenophilus sp. AP218F]|nr:hypothetical protein CEK28_08720 [Xenophilus sp. AP218F]
MQARDNGGNLLLDSNLITPWFSGTVGMGRVLRDVNLGGLQQTTYQVDLPPNCLAFLQLPLWQPRGVRYIEGHVDVPGTSLTIARPPGMAAALPVYYLFSTDPPPAYGGYGLQLFNEQGRLTFNSNARHLRIRSLVGNINVRDNNTLPISFAKPAFILPNVMAFRSSQIFNGRYPTESSHFWMSRNSWQMQGNQLCGEFVDVFYRMEDSGSSMRERYSGPLTGYTVMAIDAAWFD